MMLPISNTPLNASTCFQECPRDTVKVPDRVVRKADCASLTPCIKATRLGRSIGLLLTSPHQGVCSASITTAVSSVGRIIAVCS